MVDIRFTDMPGMWQHTSYPAPGVRAGRDRRGPGLRRLVDPRLQGHQRVRHAAACRTRPPPSSTRSWPHKTLVMICGHQGPGHQGVLQPRPARHRQEGRGLPEEHRASATPPISVPRPSSSSSTTSSTAPASNIRATASTRAKATGTRNRDEGPNLGYKIRPKEGYFPCPPNDTLQDLRAEMALTMIEHRPRRSNASTTRWRPPASARST